MKRKNSWIYHIAVVLALMYAVIIRIPAVGYPDAVDSSLDYLVSHHIVRYGALPLTGPLNPVLPDSPVYYYLLSFILRIHDSVLFLNYANLAIQIMSYGMLYGIGLLLFTPTAAFTAVSLYAFSGYGVTEAVFIHQPHIMEFFALAAYLCLAYAYRSGRIAFLYIGGICIVTAGSIHNPAFAVLIPYVWISLVLLKRTKKAALQTQLLGIVYMSTVLVYYLPVFYYLLTHPAYYGISVEKIQAGIIPGLSVYADHILNAVGIFFTVFYFRTGPRFVAGFDVASLAVAMTIPVSIVYILRYSKHRSYIPNGIIAGVMVQFVLLASVFNNAVWYFSFAPVAGLFLLSWSSVLDTVLAGTHIKNILKICVLMVCMYTFSYFPGKISPEKADVTEPLIDQAVQSIASDVIRIQQERNFAGKNFFIVMKILFPERLDSRGFLDVSGTDPYDELTIGTALESVLNIRLFRVSESGEWPVVLNNADYVYVVCQFRNNETDTVLRERCVRAFKGKYAGYAYMRDVFALRPFMVYLLKK